MTTDGCPTTGGPTQPVENSLGELATWRVFVAKQPRAAHLVDATDTTRRAPCLRCGKTPAGYWHGYTTNEAVRADSLPLCQGAPSTRPARHSRRAGTRREAA